MDRQKLKKTLQESDSPVENGVFMNCNGDYKPYDVRRAADYFRQLNLSPGDQLPDEYKQLCEL